MNGFMKFISGVFHPLLLSTYMMCILYVLSPEIFGSIGVQQIPILILAIALTTVVFPAMVIGAMKVFSSKVSSYELTQREERIMPFISITIFYGATTYMFITEFRVTPVLSTMLLIVTSLILSLLIITFWFKISIHASANWSVAGVLTYLAIKQGDIFLTPLIIWILIAGLVSTSRLYQGFHSPKEVWIGTTYGYLYALAGMLFLD